jgi:hypothetical protein
MPAAANRPFSIITPGSYGLNTQSTIDEMDPRFALMLLNAVQDTQGRTGSRKGYAPVTSPVLSGAPAVQQLVEYVRSDGSTQLLACANNNIYLVDPVAGTMTSKYSAGITANNWSFTNFNSYGWFFQRGHAPLRWDGTTMVTIASLGGAGTAPQAHTVLGAFGRLWAADTSADKVTVYFSDTLAGGVWSGGTAGFLNLNTVWPNGMDTVVALAAFQAYLVIFGRKSILLYANPGTPANLSLADHVHGVGCIARDSIQDIGTDLYFLSDTGIRTLARSLQTETLPLTDISQNVRDALLGYVTNENSVGSLEYVRSVYHEPDGFYLLAFPASGVDYCFNIRSRLGDGTNAATLWNQINPSSMCSSRNRTLYMGHAGFVSTHSGYVDNGSAYDFDFLSPWFPLGSPATQDILKKLLYTFVGVSGQAFTAKWFWDYTGQIHQVQSTFSASDSPAEYAIGEYGFDEYVGGVVTAQVSVPGEGAGKVLQVGFLTRINGQPLAFHKLDAYTKPGRMI